MIDLKETVKIYIDAESLFDIRQGILYKYTKDKDKLLRYLTSEDYNYRMKDSFPLVSDEVYQNELSAIKNDVLEYSTLTHIYQVLLKRLDKFLTVAEFKGQCKVPEIILNVYPFRLNQQQMDHVQNLLFYKLNTDLVVTVVRMEPQEVSPLYFSTSEFNAGFIYNFTQWGNHHIKSLEACKLTNAPFCFAPIQKNDVDEKLVVKLGFKDMFSYTEFLLSSVIQLNFLPMPFYSNLQVAEHYLKQMGKEVMKRPLSEELENAPPKSDIIVL